jgi:hypothetical protein
MNLLRSPLLREEGGWALITSIILLTVMMASGLAFASVVDTQTGASRDQRVRETAFNLAESALSAQVFQLSSPGNWPGFGNASTAYTACVPGAADPRCPAAAQLTQAFSSVDLGTGATWRTDVRDNVTGSEVFYDDVRTAPNPGYDSNNDRVVWVRAQATARGKTRTLVALVRAELQDEDIPRAAVIAGRMDFSNAGNKAMILGNGEVIARCDPLASDPRACLGQPYVGGLPTERNITQLGGSTPVANPSMPSALTPAARLRFKQTASTNGTLYESGCPASLTGEVVYIVSATCRYTGTGTHNTAASPGFVIIESGYLEMKEDFFGVIYHANLTNATGEIVKIHGDGLTTGGVLLDGPGQLTIGSSKENLQFDPNAFGAVKSLGSATVIQNTWREIKSR